MRWDNSSVVIWKIFYQPNHIAGLVEKWWWLVDWKIDEMMVDGWLVGFFLIISIPSDMFDEKEAYTLSKKK